VLAEIQGAVLDFLHRAGLPDSDGFAREAALRYLQSRAMASDPAPALGRIRTSAFSAKPRERTQLTRALISLLDRRFSARIARAEEPFVRMQATRSPAAAAKRIYDPTRKLSKELERFKAAVEARSVSDFWVKRTKGVLKKKPESIGQALLIQFLSGLLRTPKQGTVLREVQSGIGYVDVMVFLATSEPLIVELKVLPVGSARGEQQLRAYLKTEGVKFGWLVTFDARKNGALLPEGADTSEGITVQRIVVKINPPAPSSLR
jgi:hypothetical protein